MHRRETGDLAFDIENAALSDAYRSTQSGWYLQGVYQFRPRWRAGLRYDALDSGNPQIGLVTFGALTAADFPALLPGDPTRTTLMLDWNPSEFSRLRVQYAWDDARDGGDTDQQSSAAVPLRHRRARRAQVLGAAIMKNFIRGALALLLVTLALPSQAAVRVLATTADWGALTKELGGERVDVYTATTRDAGRASRRGQAEPRRARAHGGPPRRERRRARGRLAADPAAGIGQSEDPARRARVLRGDLRGHARRGADEARPRDGRHPSVRQSAHPARSPEYRRGREGADGETVGRRSGGRGLLR